MKTIFLFVPNYVYITDIIRTGFLQSLGKKFRMVVYLPTLEYVGLFPECSNVEYRLWHVRSMRFWGYLKTLRLGLISQFDDLLSIQIHYQFGFGDWRRRVLRRLALISPFKFSARLFTSLESLFLPMRADFKKDVANYKPCLVAVCTPGFTDFEAEAIVLAKKLGLATVAVNFSWDNLTTNAKHIRHTDYLVTWNKYIKDEAIRYHGYAEKDIYISGPMRFDRYFIKSPTNTKEQFIKDKGLDPRLPLLVLTTTSHGVYPHHAKLIEDLLKIRQSKNGPDFNLLVRVHPKDDISRYEDFKDRENVCLEIPGHIRKLTGDSRHKIEMEERDLENLQNTLSHADIVINYGSTITLEALACDTRVINICFPKEPARRHYEYVHYKPIVESGAVYIANDEIELASLVKGCLTNPADREEKRARLVEAFFYKTDGRSSERCADAVAHIVSRL